MTDQRSTVRLVFVFCQYDRQKYRGALERLVQLAEGWSEVDWRIIVLDNARPGEWSHEVSGRITHVGGDNSGWEFSAFDKGVAFAAQQAEWDNFDLFVLVTDAFQAYGNEYLEIIDEFAIHTAIDSGACVGWMDSFGEECRILDFRYDTWIRTNFLLIPTSVLTNIQPLCLPLDEQTIFGSGSEQPFGPAAPASANLQRLILEWLVKKESNLPETWHSRFVLNEETFPLFKAKTLAILREHLLSARLKASGVPCLDYRIVRRAAQSGFSPQRLIEDGSGAWQWLRWKEADCPDLPTTDIGKALYSVDECVIPEVICHGDQAELHLAAWVAANPQPSKVLVEFSGDGQATLPIDKPRPDVKKVYTSIVSEVCGVLGKVPLPDLPVGNHIVDLVVPGTDVRHYLGSLRVIEAFRFDLRTTDVAVVAFNPDRIWLTLTGIVECTHEVAGAILQIDGAPSNIKTVLSPLPRLGSGFFRYDLHAQGDHSLDPSRRQCQVELTFKNGTAHDHLWQTTVSIQGSAETPVAISQKHVGEWNPKTRLTPIRLVGHIVGAEEGDSVVLRCDGHNIYRTAIVRTEPATASNVATFVASSFEMDNQIQDLPPGSRTLSLELESASSTERRLLAEWAQTISTAIPRIHVEKIEFLPRRDAALQPLLRCYGWMEHSEQVPCLHVMIDGSMAGYAMVCQLRPDIAIENADPLARTQGFGIDLTVDIPPGTHAVQLVDPDSNGGEPLWAENLDLAESEQPELLVKSEDLNRFFSRTSHFMWSPLKISGSIETQLPDIEISLHVDDRVVAGVVAHNNERFDLRWTPSKSGSFEVRMTFEADGRNLYQTLKTRVEFSVAKTPSLVSDVLNRLLEALDLKDRIDHPVEELASRLTARHIDYLAEFYERVRKIDQALRLSDAAPIRNIQTTPVHERDDQPLRILFASWEVPGPRHGGGVLMRNLFKGLADRHTITLVHSYGIDEATWVDEIREFVDRVISVPRRHQHCVYRGSAEFPGHFYNNYTPELRTAIQAELLNNTYDIIDYEYTIMFPHMVTTSVPDVLTVIEEGVTAQANTYFTEPAGIEIVAEKLDDLFSTFYFYSTLLPERIPHLIALTEDDAAALLRFQQASKVFVNPIGVDLGGFVNLDKFKSAPMDPPSFVFLGNYRHPPNIAAALEFATSCMPRIRTRYPTARFYVIGGFVPPELQATDGAHGTEILGFVEDFRPILRNATAFVAPIKHGTGMRVKVLESMACGTPVVATSLAVQGLGATPGKDYLLADSHAEFAEACIRLAADPELHRTLSKRSLILVREKHSCETRAREREAIWHHIIEQHQQDDI